MDEVKVEIPQARLLDYLSTQRDLSLAIIKAIGKVEQAIRMPAYPDKQSLKNALITGQYQPYQIKKFALDNARTDELWPVEGDSIWWVTDGNFTGLSIKTNHPTADSIALDVYKDWSQRFFQIFLTSTAQAGKSLWLAVGRDGAVSALGAQNSGVYLQPEWAAKIGIDKTFDFEEFAIPPDTWQSFHYLVPPGVKFYITEVTFQMHATALADRELNQMCHLFIWDFTSNATYMWFGGNGGGALSLSKPIVIPSGHTVYIEVGNSSNHNGDCRMAVAGYEV